MVTTVSSQEFQEKVLDSKKPVLVDFFATWCGPCKRVSPVVDEIASEMNGKIDVYKIDIDESSDVASRYGVMSVPTLVLFEGGQAKRQMVGAQPKTQIVSMING